MFEEAVMDFSSSGAKLPHLLLPLSMETSHKPLREGPASDVTLESWVLCGSIIHFELLPYW